MGSKQTMFGDAQDDVVCEGVCKVSLRLFEYLTSFPDKFHDRE